MNRKKWDALHVQLKKADDAKLEYELALARKYGASFRPSWLTTTERKKLDALHERASGVSDKIIDLLVKISPRGERWLSGVPSHWITRDLTWEDAIRPADEPLSVVPPLAYGATTPIREKEGIKHMSSRRRPKPTKAIQDQIDTLSSWMPSFNHGPEDFPTLVWRILASLPGGDEAEDMGYEPFNIGWKEAEMIGEMLEAIQDKRDVEDLVQGLMADGESDEDEYEEEEDDEG